MKDNHNELQQRQNWIELGTKGAEELNRTLPDLAKAECLVMEGLELVMSAGAHRTEDRFVDQAALLCILAHVYACQHRIALSCMVADFVADMIIEKWPADCDPGLILWQQLVERIQQFYLQIGRPDKALDLAVIRLERITELTELLLEEQDDFAPGNDWIGDELPQAERAVLHIRMRQCNDEEKFDELRQLLRDAS